MLMKLTPDDWKKARNVLVPLLEVLCSCRHVGKFGLTAVVVAVDDPVVADVVAAVFVAFVEVEMILVKLTLLPMISILEVLLYSIRDFGFDRLDNT